MPGETDDIGYDAEAFMAVIVMLVWENPDASLAELWPLIDWPALRWHGEGSIAYHGRMDRLREERVSE